MTLNDSTREPLPPEDGEDISAGADLTNLRLGEFQLLRRLGSGGMADVYLGEQKSLGRYVAVKVLKNDAITGGSGVLLQRFEREAKTAGALSHPNLVQIITTGREGDFSYIVQEYVSGLNLSQWLKKHGPPDFGTGLKWMQQMAAALRAASEAGVVHRDVKPENVMITRTGIAKVTDFGLAQLNQPNSPKMNLTQAGTTMGTPWYMSPEQIQGEKLDHRSDQYSLGITCYHMFAGQAPFPGRNAVTVAVQHLKEEPAPLISLRADLPREMCDVVHRMIQKKPQDRFQSESELEAALLSLNAVPVNARLGASSGWLGYLQNWSSRLPSLRATMLLTICAFVPAFVVGKRMDRVVPLPADAEDQASSVVPKEATAARQFGAAMLQPDRVAAWRAVCEYFPDAPEADIAGLRVGIALMSGVSPAPNQAAEQFKSIRDKGEIDESRSYLKLLGMLGQVYALKNRPRDDQMDVLTTEIEAETANLDEDEIRAILERGPAELRQLYFRMFFRNDDMMFGPFG